MLSDLDLLSIGCTLATVTKDVHGHPASFGLVVDVGMHEDTGKPYVEVLQEVPHREVKVAVYYKGAKVPKMVNVARLNRLDLEEVDPDTVEAPNISRMQGWAKKALAGELVLPGRHFHLAIIAAQLYEAAEQVQQADRERRESEAMEREGLAS